MRASSNNAEAAQECFAGTRDQIAQEVQDLASKINLFPTQDIKIILPKYSVPVKGEITDENRAAGHVNTTFLDSLNRILIKDDAHYSKFKFERQSNFKTGMVNSLGLFENPAVYRTIMN